MARQYVVQFSGVTVSDPQDLVCLFLDNNGYAEVTRFCLMNTSTSLETAQMLQLECAVIENATVGSSGSLAGVQQLDGGDTAAGVTALVNDTMQASGSENIVFSGGCYLFQGIDYVFQEPVPFNSVGSTTAFVFRLVSNPSGSITLSGSVYFNERGLTGS